MDRSYRIILSAALSLAAAAGTAACNETKSVGLISAHDRKPPLTPATRAALEAQGVACTPNPTGPVLCSWSGGGATCQLTFDQADSLTHLQCSVDGLTWECTRPGNIYTCSWSDDPDCADVYTLDGVFEAYLCGADLQDRINNSRPDAGQNNSDAGTNDPDGGTIVCAGLDEAACTAAGAACRIDTCTFCGPQPQFWACAAPDAAPAQCPPVICPACESITDLTACDNEPGCHPVYQDSQACGCATPGCCASFVSCKSGSTADCQGLDLACRVAEPHCEGPYVVSYNGNCYEGCSLEARCDPAPISCAVAPEVFPTFEDGCATTDSCAAGIRQKDCCGTERALGINVGEVDRFARAASVCSVQYPDCGCANLGIQTDDGAFAPDPAHVGVRCESSQCETFVIP